MKHIQLIHIENPQTFVVVEETETTVTYRKHFSKNPRNFITINKKFVRFV